MGEGEDYPLKWQSLRNRRQFAKVYDEGVRLVGRLLVVYLLPAEDQAQAVVASRKIGNAVRRNQAKRLLREALRNSVLSKPGGIQAINEKYFSDREGRRETEQKTPGLWVVVIARRPILAVKTPAVIEEIDRLLP
jgi:RNase P protein component